MHTSLDHLPERKREDLARLVHMIREACAPEVEMIILYGSYARGDWKEERDLPPRHERTSGHASDYDILIITRTEAAAESIEMRTTLDRKAANLGLSARPRFIAYDVHAFNDRLREGRFFYADIRREGRMLYDSRQFELADATALSPAERYRIAHEYYEQWFDSAQGFFKFFEFGMQENDLKRAAFQLHQAAEAAYKTILLVFTGYSPDQHWLALLADMVGGHAPGVETIIPQDGPGEESRLFKLLDYAYIGARYDAKYTITRPELEYLSARVRALLDRTQSLCTTRLQALQDETAK